MKGTCSSEIQKVILISEFSQSDVFSAHKNAQFLIR